MLQELHVEPTTRQKSSMCIGIREHSREGVLGTAKNIGKEKTACWENVYPFDPQNESILATDFTLLSKTLLRPMSEPRVAKTILAIFWNATFENR